MLADFILGSYNRVCNKKPSFPMKRLLNFFLVLNGTETPTQLVTKHSML